MTPKRGIRALDRLVRQDTASSCVAMMDWSVFATNLTQPAPFFEEVLPRAAISHSDTPTPSGNLLSRLHGAADGESLLVSFLQEELKAILRLPSAPSPTVGFFELGMDSLMAVQLRNRLNRALSGDMRFPTP